MYIEMTTFTFSVPTLLIEIAKAVVLVVSVYVSRALIFAVFYRGE